MKMIQQSDRAQKIATAQQITYENVKFHSRQWFINLLNEMARDKLISEDWHNEKGVWSDLRHRDGIMVETAENPLQNKTTSRLTISGSLPALLKAKSLMEEYAKYDGKPEPEDIELSYQYHDELNDMLWDEEGDSYTLDGDVRDIMIKNAEAFFEHLKIEDLEVEDVLLTGSAANFNWTEHSDIDLHLVVDMDKAETQYGPIIREYFDAKKRLWNDLHNVSIRGFPIEFYVEDSAEEHVSTGVYSIVNNDWIIEPTHEEPSVDDRAVKAKTAELIGEIQDVMSSNKASAVEKLMERIRKMRQSGLSENGEHSVENLAFKHLRNEGWLEKMSEFRTKTYDRDLSIEDEEWSTYC